VQVGFDGLGRDSYFSALGVWSWALCRWVLMYWVKIAIFLPLGADLGHYAVGFFLVLVEIAILSPSGVNLGHYAGGF
jgi:hypothetical protein